METQQGLGPGDTSMISDLEQVSCPSYFWHFSAACKVSGKAQSAGNGHSIAKGCNTARSLAGRALRELTEDAITGQAEPNGGFRVAEKAMRAQPQPVLHSWRISRYSLQSAPCTDAFCEL
jgi:hypothetical protein